jgi:hypothetical protein
VTVAHRADDLAGAFSLLHQAYADKGLEPPSAARMRITPQHVLRESVVLIALEGERVVGTLTVVHDSPAGLPLDKDYPVQLEKLRETNARIVEYGSLAVHPNNRHTGVTTLLFMAAQWATRHVFGATHVCIGVNPKAAPMYNALFAFDPLGPARDHAELTAPVLGLVHDANAIPAFFEKHHNKRRFACGHTVYEHFIQRLPRSIDLPSDLLANGPQAWKLPREAFQEIFMRRTDRIERLDASTRAYLERQRSDDTLTIAHAS